jgi:hypothetical protein
VQRLAGAICILERVPLSRCVYCAHGRRLPSHQYLWIAHGVACAEDGKRLMARRAAPIRSKIRLDALHLDMRCPQRQDLSASRYGNSHPSKSWRQRGLDALGRTKSGCDSLFARFGVTRKRPFLLTLAHGRSGTGVPERCRDMADSAHHAPIRRERPTSIGVRMHRSRQPSLRWLVEAALVLLLAAVVSGCVSHDQVSTPFAPPSAWMNTASECLGIPSSGLHGLAATSSGGWPVLVVSGTNPSETSPTYFLVGLKRSGRACNDIASHPVPSPGPARGTLAFPSLIVRDGSQVAFGGEVDPSLTEFVTSDPTGQLRTTSHVNDGIALATARVGDELSARRGEQFVGSTAVLPDQNMLPLDDHSLAEARAIAVSFAGAVTNGDEGLAASRVVPGTDPGWIVPALIHRLDGLGAHVGGAPTGSADGYSFPLEGEGGTCGVLDLALVSNQGKVGVGDYGLTW